MGGNRITRAPLRDLLERHPSVLSLICHACPSSSSVTCDMRHVKLEHGISSPKEALPIPYESNKQNGVSYDHIMQSKYPSYPNISLWSFQAHTYLFRQAQFDIKSTRLGGMDLTRG